MDVFEAIKKRRSIRSYLDRAVEEEKIRKILEAARLAPSASNRQEWRFIVVRDRAKRSQLAQAAKNQKFIEEAPVVIVCCAETDSYKMTCGQLCYPIDVAIAIDHMTLVAVEEGLGTCWIGAFYEEEAKKILNIPASIRVVELLTLGYPRQESHSLKSRLPLEKIIFFEKW
ncbi:MAG: nitroreductase family protein [Candidatus Omnitrophota bacterium]|nr:MAG: nitroreductase family protein [Candidatus Omnitrophota bacterium]